MNNRKLVAISFAVSIILHILLFIALVSLFSSRYNTKPPKIPKNYIVDIVTLKQPSQHKIVKKKEKHKIAANIQKQGVSKKYSKQEKIPIKTIKKPIISKPIKRIAKKENSKPKPTKEKKVLASKRKKYTPKKEKSEMLVSKQQKRIKKLKKKKEVIKKAPKTIKITGGFYNPKAVISNKSHKGLLSGNSKEYEYKNTKREATVTLGTQSLKYASYMQHVKDKIQNVWIYPQEAQENGQQGQLLILFSIDKNGNVVRLSLLRSSGYPILDKAALEAVKDAAPFPPLPKRLHIDRLNIYATFLYKLGFYYVY